MEEIIRSRKMDGLTPDDRRQAEAALAALTALRTITVAALVVGTVIFLSVFVAQLRGQLALPLLVVICVAVLAGDAVAGVVIRRALDRQRAGLAADIDAGQVEEIICLVPDGFSGYAKLTAACNLPAGGQPGASQVSRTLALARRRLVPGQELRLRILSGCRYLLSATPH